MRIKDWLPSFAMLVVLSVATVFAATAASAMSQGQSTFSDPAGDGHGGPDVTTVAIDGDAASGTIRVSVTATGVLAISPSGLEQEVCVWLDTDKSTATGDPNDGTDFGLVVWNDSTGRYWDMQRWNGSDWDAVPEHATTGFSRNGDVYTWTLNKSDLGGAEGFRFYVHADNWDPTTKSEVAVDEAPDSGWWDYTLSGTSTAPSTPTKTVTLEIFAPKTTPATAVAGKRFAVSFLAAVETTGMVTKIGSDGITTVPMTILRFVTSGKMVCDPSVGGKVIAHSESFKKGMARLSFVIPTAAKGKLLKVKVKLTVKDSGPEGSGKTLTASRVATFRVK
jgi:hypothetical protein